jgi:hypothetical protein
MNTYTFKTKLESNIIQLFNIGNLIGKEVIVSIIEIPKENEKKKRKWKYLGAVSADKQLDNVNIRDLAYE